MRTPELLIVAEDLATRKQMVELFTDTGYRVTAPASVAGAVQDILKQTVNVALVSIRFNDLFATEVIPLLRRCKRDLTIILVAGELPLAVLRKARREGIFYHALRPEQPGDEEELREAVRCAFDKAGQGSHGSSP